MAFAFVQGKSNHSGSTPVTAAFTSAITAGNAIVLAYSADAGNATSSFITGITDNLGNTYTFVPGTHGANAAGTLDMGFYVCHITTGGTATISVAFTDTQTNMGFIAQEFSGFTATPTVDQFKQTFTATASTAPNSGATATTTQTNELVVASGNQVGTTASTFSLGTGFTNLTTDVVAAYGSAMESKVVSSTGAQTGTFTLSASRVWGCQVITLYDNGTPPPPSGAAPTRMMMGMGS